MFPICRHFYGKDLSQIGITFEFQPKWKLYFHPKCDSSFEEEEESYENSDVENDEAEIQLKDIFFGTKLLQVLLLRNFYHWINAVPSQNSNIIFGALKLAHMQNVTVLLWGPWFNLESNGLVVKHKILMVNWNLCNLFPCNYYRIFSLF